MAKIRLAAARPSGRANLPTADAVVARERPATPLYSLRPAAIEAAGRAFLAAFPGEVLYAVKCNPEPRVLGALWAAGVRHFDCASIAEVALVGELLPDAAVHFMHPVKGRAAIAAAYRRHGVRDFALDCEDELEKILQESVPLGLVGEPPTLGLFVRLALPKGGAVCDLSGKFGAPVAEAARLLRLARPHAGRLGLTFHVGSQCLEPQAYARAIALAGAAIEEAQVAVDIVDVGGGFPVAYPGAAPPPLSAYVAAIAAARARHLPPSAALWAEPGRALAAAGGSLVVLVELRRGSALYINDGVYGSLADAGALGFRYPARRIRLGEAAGAAAPLADFTLFGPTCDSADRMRGPFRLPADTQEGDWLELGQLGAYGPCLATRFNGFGPAEVVAVADPPLAAD
jgi:ornithine decarboxylase